MQRLFLLLIILVALPAEAAEKYILAAARTAGANNTFFSTDVRILNLGEASASFTLAWLPSGSDNTAPTTRTVVIPARSALAWDDVALSLFGIESGGGAIRIRSDAPFSASSRTFTPSTSAGCSGTYGQSIPALDLTAAATRSAIAGVRLSSDGTRGFRSNAGLVNPNGAAATVTITLRSGSGVSLGSTVVTLNPYSHFQQNVALLFSQASLTDTNLFVEIGSSLPVFGYASLVDNQSGDSLLLVAEPDAGNPRQEIVMIAKQWEFVPATISAKAGTPVTLLVRSIDVDHGISFSGVGPVSCEPNEFGQCILRSGREVRITFTPRNSGSFAFFCTVHCGESHDGSAGHLTMRGTLNVQ